MSICTQATGGKEGPTALWQHRVKKTYLYSGNRRKRRPNCTLATQGKEDLSVLRQHRKRRPNCTLATQGKEGPSAFWQHRIKKAQLYCTLATQAKEDPDGPWQHWIQKTQLYSGNTR
jgi:hypothetical protein